MTIDDGCYVYEEDGEYGNCRYCNAPDWKKHKEDCEWVKYLDNVGKLQYRVNYLEAAISKLVIKHTVCEDDHGNRYNDKECMCGADDHNKFIAEVLNANTSL